MTFQKWFLNDNEQHKFVYKILNKLLMQDKKKF